MAKKIPKSAKKYISESLVMMTTAFGLVAALAWNEAIKALINEFVPKGAGIISLFTYAAVVTVVAITLSGRLLKLKKDLEEEEGGG